MAMTCSKLLLFFRHGRQRRRDADLSVTRAEEFAGDSGAITRCETTRHFEGLCIFLEII